MTTTDANTAVLDALCIPWKGQNFAAVTIRLRAGELPSVHTVRHILHKDLPGITQQHQRFTLIPAEPEGFDLDAACQQAMDRLATHINASADEHKRALRQQTAARLVANMKLHQAPERLRSAIAAIANLDTYRRTA